VIEQLRADGFPVRPFMTTHQSKSQVIDDLALAFEQDMIRILNDPVLVNELEAYEYHRTPSGLLSYGAPPNLHDDCVISLALAYHAAHYTGFDQNYLDIVRNW